jgi:hypothetical protein
MYNVTFPWKGVSEERNGATGIWQQGQHWKWRH